MTVSLDPRWAPEARTTPRRRVAGGRALPDRLDRVSEEETPQSFVPNPIVIEEYNALVAGEYADGDLGRLLVVVSTVDLGMSRGDLYVAMGLSKYLRRLGWGITLWPTERWTEQTPAGYDAAIVMIETFVPGLVHPDTQAIAWVRNWTERWAELPYLDSFGQIWCSSAPAATRIREVYSGPVEIVPLATDHELFTPADVEREPSLVTTANFWGVNRGLKESIVAVAALERVTWFGKNARFLELPPSIDHRHTIDYFSLPWVYSTWQFVIDDVIEAAAVYGTLNSRLFDALACGAIVLTNTSNGLEELGLEDVPTYDGPDTLVERVKDFRANPERAAALSAALRAVVLERHTYEVRAAFVSGLLQRSSAPAARSELLSWTTNLREDYRSEQFEHARLRTAYHDLYEELLRERDAVGQLQAALASYQTGRLRRYWRYVKRAVGR